jgi:hypothetical protein
LGLDRSDGFDEMAFHGWFSPNEPDDSDPLKKRTRLFPTDARGWTMETLLVFLNDIGDDWSCSRHGRIEVLFGAHYFTCTFRHLQFRNLEIHIRYQLLRLGRDLRPLFLEDPEVLISLAWINYPTPARDRVNGVDEGLEPHDSGGDPGEHGDRDDPSIDEVTEEGLNDLDPRPDQNDLMVDDPRYPMGRVWESRIRPVFERFDDRDRRTKKPQYRMRVEFRGQLIHRESSSLIWRNGLQLIHDWREFSWPARYFAQRLPVDSFRLAIPVLEMLRSSLEVIRTVPASNHSADDFLALPGLLGLNLAVRLSDERLEPYEYKKQTYSILSGYWVSPLAESILRENEIDGLIMDTTFRVMRQYYTAILVAVRHNVGIPLAISFGPRESVELYNTFYEVFDHEFHINLAGYILESDQGSALKAVGKHHPRHLFCLRHVLKSLHSKDCGRFASLVGNLISARSERELDLLYEIYTPDFAAVYREAGAEKLQLEKCLKKVGRGFVDGVITFTDSDRTRWRQVSMLERVGTRMPTTSNRIESLNGRDNEKKPRFNSFWGSLHRLREAILRKTGNYFFSVKHNLSYEMVRAERRGQILPADRMRREMDFFETTAEHCSCGETVFASGMYRTDVLCSHRFRHGLLEGFGFPPRPSSLDGITDLNLTMQWTSCGLKVKICPRLVFPPVDPSREAEVVRLVRLIVRDAHAHRRREEVKVFVERELNDSEKFALGESSSFLAVHQAGVSLFRCRKAQTRSDVVHSELAALGRSS